MNRRTRTTALALAGVAVLTALGARTASIADQSSSETVGAYTTTSESLTMRDEAREPEWITPQSVTGTGHFRLHGPNVEGDQITFGFNGRRERTGLMGGGFRVRHHSPATEDEPAWTAHGTGKVVCLKVKGQTALLTTVMKHEVVPGYPDGIGPHAFYLKLRDGVGDKADRVAFIQGPPPPGRLAGCADPGDWPRPGQVDRAALDSGDWRLRGPAR